MSIEEDFNRLAVVLARSFYDEIPTEGVGFGLQKTMSIEEEFRRLAMVLARAFYNEIPAKGVDPGVGVVVLDALTRRQWVREDKLAECLKLQFKQLKRTLRFFEAEKLVITEQWTRREYKPKMEIKMRSLTCGGCFHCAESIKAYSVALSATTDDDDDDDEKKKKRKKKKKTKTKKKMMKKTILMLMEEEEKKKKKKKKIDSYFGSEGEEKKIDDSYFCLNYAQMRAVVSERLQRMEKNLTDGMEVQLKPLRDQLSVVKDLKAPGYGTLAEWKLRRKSARGFDPDSACKRLTSMGSDPGLPSWIVKQRMLEERWEQKSKMEGTSASMDLNGSKEIMSLQDELNPSLPSTSRTPHQPEGEGDSERKEETSIPNLESEIKKLLDLLCGARTYLTAEKIKDQCGVDVQGNRDLFKGLQNYPNVKYTRGLFYYQSKHCARDKEGLVQALHTSPDGIPVAELKDEYPAAMEDLQALNAHRYIYLLRNTDVDLEMAYTRYDDRAPLTGVDDELKKLFRSADLPSDLPEENGLEPKSAKRPSDLPEENKSAKRTKMVDKTEI